MGPALLTARPLQDGVREVFWQRERGSQVRGALAVREGLGTFCARRTDLWASCGGQRRLQRSGLGRPVVLGSMVTASAAVAGGVKQGGGRGACGKDIWPGGHRCLPWHPWPWPLPVRGGPATSAAPVPALCSLHSRGQTPQAAVPSSLAGLSLGAPLQAPPPIRSCEVLILRPGSRLSAAR